ncbi:hypothetical protein MXD81_30400 [Microbacteriaceae bacterium K1510]|nr:hypothetical protein [Microbacteriaceae bacterium K1510]
MTPDLESKLMQALGKATVARWGELPQSVQQALFEGAAPIKVDDFREALAVYLHDHHPRTAH